MTRATRSGFIELVEEQLEIGKREVERGRVVVRTRVEERDAIAEIELRQDEVTVERISRGVPVETTPTVREEDGVLIVPVIEEQLLAALRPVMTSTTGTSSSSEKKVPYFSAIQLRLGARPTTSSGWTSKRASG